MDILNEHPSPFKTELMTYINIILICSLIPIVCFADETIVSNFHIQDSTHDDIGTAILSDFPALIDKPGLFFLNASSKPADMSITITHSDIILDGMGMMLNGSESSGSIGISLIGQDEPLSNITIQNLTIQYFDTGIMLENAHDASLHDLRIISNLRTGIRLSSSYNIHITNSTVQNTRNDITGGCGMHISHSKQIDMINMLITGNGKSSKSSSGGIGVQNSTDVSIKACQITSNSGFGVKVTEQSHTLSLSDCTISANSGDGIIIQSSDSPEIRNCILEKNKESGIELQYVKAPQITGNVISSSSFGLSFSDTEEMSLSGNAIKNCKIGFDISASDLRYYNHHVSYTNTIDSRVLLYLNNAHSRTIGPGINPSMVIIVNSSDISLSDMVLSKNGAGIIVANSSNLTISDISLLDNGIGLRTEFQTRNLSCTNLHAEGNLVCGYYLSDTKNFTIHSLYGQQSPCGIILQNSSDGYCNAIVMTDISGTKSRMPSGITLKGCSHITIAKSLCSRCSYAGLLSDSHEINLTENTFSSNAIAGSLILSGPVNIWNNTFLNNEDTGMILKANNSSIMHNTFSHNVKRGVLLLQGDNNTFAYNTFKNPINCVIQDSPSHNSWNNSIEEDEIYTARGGNYWGDLKGMGFSDLCTPDSNGFCTDPYIIQKDNIDYHPLAADNSTHALSLNTDINQNGHEDLQDVVLYMNLIASGNTSDLYDYSGDGTINLNDVVALFHIIIKK